MVYIIPHHFFFQKQTVTIMVWTSSHRAFLRLNNFKLWQRWHFQLISGFVGMILFWTYFITNGCIDFLIYINCVVVSLKSFALYQNDYKKLLNGYFWLIYVNLTDVQPFLVRVNVVVISRTWSSQPIFDL